MRLVTKSALACSSWGSSSRPTHHLESERRQRRGPLLHSRHRYTSDGSQPKRTRPQSSQGSAFARATLQRPTYHESPGRDAGTADPSNGSPQDQDHGTRRRAAYDRTHFEDEESDNKSPLYRQACVQFAEQQLEGAGGEEVGGSVPRGIIKRVEVGGDLGNGGSDDGPILEGNPDCQKQSGEELGR